jgi:hypothetical protein
MLEFCACEFRWWRQSIMAAPAVVEKAIYIFDCRTYNHPLRGRRSRLRYTPYTGDLSVTRWTPNGPLPFATVLLGVPVSLEPDERSHCEPTDTPGRRWPR